MCISNRLKLNNVMEVVVDIDVNPICICMLSTLLTELETIFMQRDMLLVIDQLVEIGRMKIDNVEIDRM